MSTSDYDLNVNKSPIDSESVDANSKPMEQSALIYSEEYVETQQIIHDHPMSPPVVSAPRPESAKGSRPSTPRPKSPISKKESEMTYGETCPFLPNYNTECDLAATTAPSELLPQIDSSTTCSKTEEKLAEEPDVKKETAKVKKGIPVKGRFLSGIPKKSETIQSNSIIPVKITKQSSKLSIKPSRTSSFCKSQLRTPKTVTNKHTLEMQFLNKHKKLIQYKKELSEKQRPVMDLYQNLLEIKKQLAEFGKSVELEEIKFVSMEEPKKHSDHPCGDVLNQEIVQNMKTSIEDIPKQLMGVCQNLVGRRAAIVELLESVSQADIEPTELTDKIETLKDEGKDLKNSLDLLIAQSEERITELVKNWYTLLDSKNQETSNMKLEEYESQIRQKDAMVQESKQVILDLQKKLEEKRNLHEKTICECEITIKEYTENIKKLNHELECERRSMTEVKTRNAGNGQTIKNLRQKLNETESKLKDVESKNTDLSKKLKTSQDQQRQKENIWFKEKEEMQKNIKEQDKLLSKLTDDRNSFQTRLEVTQNKKKIDEDTLRTEMEELKSKLEKTEKDLDKIRKEKTEAIEKYESLEGELQRLGHEHEKNMDTISKQMDWGKSIPCPDAQAELYSELLATKVTLREQEEKIKAYEKENARWAAERSDLLDRLENIHNTPDIRRQEEIIVKYKNMLQENEMKLNDKSIEVAKLSAELKHLKIRQDALEEQNLNCPTDELRKMVADGRQKLSEIMKKSMENEQKLACYESTIEKQHKQMNEMENLLRVRDGLIGMIKAKKDELLMEKESLTRYCKDVRNMLAETREDLKVKSEVIRDLQDKLEKKEKTVVVLEKKIRELEENLAYTNEKRFKLQDTIGTMEKELQSTKAHVNQMAELQSRYDLGMTNSKNNILKEMSSQNPTFESLTFHQPNGEFNLDLPIREMDCIRRRLYKLSNFQLPVALSDEKSRDKTNSCNVLHSTQSLYTFSNKNTYQKMIELESKRKQLVGRI
ncbi:myosin-10-like isoform X3 [Harmonia axyridis]|uniref:myosin-10-like isoform X3 n=1 Tax=Harmonia axyridis TaxID=115357 RepID=UPI001E2768B0|nr:myosin-10-like isoform X3 [Harmonia axyridis]